MILLTLQRVSYVSRSLCQTWAHHWILISADPHFGSQPRRKTQRDPFKKGEEFVESLEVPFGRNITPLGPLETPETQMDNIYGRFSVSQKGENRGYLVRP